MLLQPSKSQSLANRRLISLNGEWAFQLDPAGDLSLDTIAPAQTIPVPLPWQALSPEMRAYKGWAWYRRAIYLTPDFLAGEVLLRFGAVDYWCEVFVNGHKVGEHEGGFTPFTFNVRRYVSPGENVIAVRVFDPIQDKLEFYRFPDQRPSMDAAQPFAETEIPHGKQEWYVNIGGIWQDVTLEAVAPAWIDLLHVTPDLGNEQARIDLRLNGALDLLDGAAVTLSIRDGEETVSSFRMNLKAGAERYSLHLPVANPRLWSLEDPHLYSLHAVLEVAEQVHESATRFGMRSFESRDGQFLLNGQPVYLLAALDQDFYPETIFTTPSEDYLRDQFTKAKELGLNTLRIHIKVPDPVYFDLADEMGLLVWAEIPSWRTFFPRGTLDQARLQNSAATRERVRQVFQAMLERDHNHPALVIRTLVNEDWGTTLAHCPEDRAWLAQFFDEAKAADPSRLVVDNSPCNDAWTPNLHVKSDIEDFHFYTSYPEGIGTWQKWVKNLARRPLWTYSGHGEAQRTGREPLVLSEFGNWSLPELGKLRASAGIPSGEPEWMNVLPWGATIWDKQMTLPPGVEDRFLAYGLSRIWPTYDDFARATQWSQYEAMKHEIEILRREPGFQGYVITEMTDIYWESNGLLDFARNPKAYQQVFRRVNAPDVVSADVERRAFTGGELVEISLWVSHYSGGAEKGASLAWSVDGGSVGTLDLPPAPRGSAGLAGKVFLRLPEVTAPQAIRMTLVLLAPDGRELARNHTDLATYPAAVRQAPAIGAIFVPQSEAAPVYGAGIPNGDSAQAAGGEARPQVSSLAGKLESLGYETTHCLTPSVRLAIANEASAELLEWVRAGGDLIFLAEGETPFYWLQGRLGVYGGSWVSAWSYIRPDLHPRLCPANPLGIEYQDVLPQQVILGFPIEQAAADGDILAGMVAGWVHNPAAHTLQFRLGMGRVIFTTFRLAHCLDRNPLAAAMLNDLAAYIRSEDCQPKLTGNY